jgi:adenosine deaminase
MTAPQFAPLGPLGPLGPLAEVPISPAVAALPKADLHLHQELFPRLDRLIARREGRAPYGWQAWARRVIDEVPPGPARLAAIFRPDETLAVDRSLDQDRELFVARIADVLEEAAAGGAIYVEVRCGADRLVALPDFMALFREAERRVQERYPRLRAEALGHLSLWNDPGRLRAEEQKLEACLHAARQGFGGVDLLVNPYDATGDPALWHVAYRWAERAAAEGLGITIHAGEFGTASVAAALQTPGLRRLGHGTHIAGDPRLLEQLIRSGATLECSLTCNVVLGSAASYAAHPIRRFVDAGVPVTLNTDLPVHACTTIGREYAVAAALGFSPADLLAFTRNAVLAAFTAADRRAALLADLRASGASEGQG